MPPPRRGTATVPGSRRSGPPAPRPDGEFDTVFTAAKPVIFAYHGYPGLVRRLTYSLHHHCNIHVRGYQEEGTTTMPFDMVVLNEMDRCEMDRVHLVMNGIDRLPGLGQRPAGVGRLVLEDFTPHRNGTRSRGEDLPEIAGWTWQTGRRS